MRQVPKKNIEPAIRDLKLRKLQEEARKDASPEELAHFKKEEEKVIDAIYRKPVNNDTKTKESPLLSVSRVQMGEEDRRRARLVKRFIFVFLLFALVFGGITAFIKAELTRIRLSETFLGGIEKFQGGISRLKDLDTTSAQESFALLKEQAGSQDLTSLFTRFWLILKGGGESIKNFRDLAEQAIFLVQEVSFLKEHWLAGLLGSESREVAESLRRLRDILKEMDALNKSFAAASRDIKELAAVDISFDLPFQLDLKRLSDFLENFLAWFTQESPHHIALFFENPSELRPGGGFIGSYGDLTVEGGAFRELKVYDVNVPDRELEVKIVPPKPIQAIASRFRAADGNWFFDFKESAAQVLELLESSELYAKEGVQFDGAIGISAEAVGQLLALLGPVELEEYKLTLTPDNFIVELQRRIERERAKESKNPKGILADFASKLYEKLSALDEERRVQLLELLRGLIEKKDIAVYFKDQKLQNFLDFYGATGRLAEFSKDWNGDYFAVVHANIGGGKTDLVMKEKVVLESQLGEDGILSNHLTITRTHQGTKYKDSWYRVTNQDYLQVFTPTGAQLESVSGASEKKIKPKVDYEKEKYLVDPLVHTIESTENEYLNFPSVKSYLAFGKNVFAMWSRTPLGAVKTITLDYSRRLPLPPAHGLTYQFIFEKQRGARAEYKFVFHAPLGFKWKENRLPLYEYTSDDPPGRLILELTLEKI